MVVSLKQRFWRAVALFAYRRWAEPQTKKPVGVPGNRDPEFPCESYSPRPIKPGDWGNCEGDGHYLCHECCHFDRRTQEEGTYQDLVGIKL